MVRLQYHFSKIDFRIDTKLLRFRKEEAGKIAFAQGISRGSRQKALETARILKQLGDSVQKIAQATGLTQEEVDALDETHS